MEIPNNCLECSYGKDCSAPYYGGSKCRYEKAVTRRTIKAFLQICRRKEEGAS